MDKHKDHSNNQQPSPGIEIMTRYPGKLPVIVERAKNSALPKMDKTKYLVDAHSIFGELHYFFRKRMYLHPEMTLFFFVGNILIPSNSTMIQIYERYKDERGFLVVTYQEESTFGSIN